MDRRSFLRSAGLAGAATLTLPSTVRAERTPLRVCLLSGSEEYRSNDMLALLQTCLESAYPVRCSRVWAKDKGSELPGIEALREADVFVVFARRIKVPEPQLAIVKEFCAAGKAVVGIRTASHAFQTWLEFDREVLGGSYKGHYPAGPACDVRITAGAKDHPILAGVQPFSSRGSLYQNPAVSSNAQVLLTGTIPGHTEPVAWTHSQRGGRVFYTSLGHPDDFKNAGFRALVLNGLFWAAKWDPRARSTETTDRRRKPQPGEQLSRLGLRRVFVPGLSAPSPG